jgi:hypothetical protein
VPNERATLRVKKRVGVDDEEIRVHCSGYNQIKVLAKIVKGERGQQLYSAHIFLSNAFIHSLNKQSRVIKEMRVYQNWFCIESNQTWLKLQFKFY